MINKIELSNFKKHDHLIVDLEEGLTSITGENAAGKTSVLKGVLFALFGAAAAGAKDHLWKWGTDGNKSVGLAMTLPDYGNVVITRTPTSAKVTHEDNRILASGNTAVTKFLEDALGMAAKDLRTLCYSPQGETQGILTMGPTALQQKVEGLAHMDTVDSVLGMISGDVSRLTGRLEGIHEVQDMVGIKRQVADLEQSLEYLGNELHSARQTEHLAQTQVDEASANHQTGLNLYNSREKGIAIIRRIQDDIAHTEGALKQVNERFDAIQVKSGEAEPRLEIVEQLLTELVTERANLDALIKSYTRVVEETAQLKNQVKVTYAQYHAHQQAQEAVDALAPQLAAASADWDTAVSIADTCKQKAATLHTMMHKAICPTCKRTMDDVDVAALEGQLLEASTALNEATAAMNTATAIRQKLEMQNKAAMSQLNPGAVALLKDQQSRLVELEKTPIVDISALEDQMRNNQQDYNYLRAEQMSLSKSVATEKELVHQLHTYSIRLQELKLALEKNNAQLLQLPEVNLEVLKGRVLDAQNHRDAIIEFRQNLLLRINQAEAELKSLKSTLIQAEAAVAEQRQLQGEKSAAEDLQSFLRKNRTRLASDIWDGLLNYSSALISNTTSGTLSDLSRTNSGDFMLKENGRDIPVTEASGAQRSIVGVSLRAALTKIFFGDNLFLLLDEPTSDASDETAAAIAGMLSSLNMKVVTVSHRTGDVVNAGNVVEIK
jgi:DNA repair exonuclease SbcCD ATPase subunit